MLSIKFERGKMFSSLLDFAQNFVIGNRAFPIDKMYSGVRIFLLGEFFPVNYK